MSTSYQDKLKLAEQMRKGTGLADGLPEWSRASVRASKVSHYLPGWKSPNQREKRGGTRRKIV